MTVYHSCSLYGNSSRHLRAQESWKTLQDRGMVPVYHGVASNIRRFDRTGDPRVLRYLRDLLKTAQLQAKNASDVILWCNDDVWLDARVLDWCESDVVLHGAISMRRQEPGRPENEHMGRELFAFRKDWLEANLHKIPDFVIGCPFFDLIIAAFIRKSHGFDSTTSSMVKDMRPSDAIERYAIHEAHQSSWSGPLEHKLPGNIHNRRLALAWCQEHMQTLRL